MPADESKTNNQSEIKNPIEPDNTVPAPLKEPLVSDTADKDRQTVTSQEPEPANDLQADKRRWLMKGGLGLIALIIALYLGIPWVVRTLNTVSTDDAYVNGHVTFVAARIPDQVVKILVDDNNRVRKGDILIELDRKPYQVLVDIKEAAVAKAMADLVAAQAEVRSVESQARSQRWKLQHAMEEVVSQIALLRAKAAVLESDKAELKLAEANFERAKGLTSEGAMASEEYDRRRKALLVAKDQIERDLAEIAQVRVDMGLPALPPKGVALTEVPSNIEQTFSSVRQAQADLIQRAAQLGIIHSFAESPKQMIDEFMKRAPHGDIDRIFAQIVKGAPAVKQAEAKLLQAQRDLEQAQLNLSYCTITADIDGVITRRNVNPGDNVQIGQGLMAIRSLREIWIDANFKETELADLRIGQPVDIFVDMYGGRQKFHGHISGFTMGTGSTLSLLPAQNATGNFIKVVQRLPVRIDLDSYDPDKVPLFIGLSVVPYVYINKPPMGPNAGKVLQPYQQISAGNAKDLPLEPKP